MKLKIFRRCSLFPSWSGQGLVSSPVRQDGFRSHKIETDYFDVLIQVPCICCHLFIIINKFTINIKCAFVGYYKK
jgi:hypothetical protein